MQEKCRKLKSYHYPIMDIIQLEDIDIVTISDSSSGGGNVDIDPDQGEWD